MTSAQHFEAHVIDRTPLKRNALQYLDKSVYQIRIAIFGLSSALSTEKPTPAILIPKIPASAVRDMPNSLAAQKHRRLLAFTFLFCRPFDTLV